MELLAEHRQNLETIQANLHVAQSSARDRFEVVIHAAIQDDGPSSAEKNLHEIDTSNLPIQKINEVWNGNLIESLREMHKKGEWFKNDVCKECVMSSANIDDAD